MKNKAPVQEITEDRSIINNTLFGSQIQKFAEDHIEQIIEDQDCGFLDGGCFLFARVIKEHLQDKYDVSYAVVGRSNNNDHAVVLLKLNNEEYFIDADGVATAQQINDKMLYAEGLHESVIKYKEEEQIPLARYERSQTEAVLRLALHNMSKAKGFDVESVLTPSKQGPKQQSSSQNDLK